MLQVWSSCVAASIVVRAKKKILLTQLFQEILMSWKQWSSEEDARKASTGNFWRASPQAVPSRCTFAIHSTITAQPLQAKNTSKLIHGCVQASPRQEMMSWLL